MTTPSAATRRWQRGLCDSPLLGVWATWTLTHLVGIVLITVLGVLLAAVISRGSAIVIVTGCLVWWYAGALLLSTGQWLALRRTALAPSQWIWWSLLGWTGAGAVGGVIALLTVVHGWPADVAWAGGAAVAGALVGLSQWLALRRRVARATLWMTVTPVAFAAGTAAAVGLGTHLGDLGVVLALPVGGMVTGAITGWALLTLLQPSLASPRA